MKSAVDFSFVVLLFFVSRLSFCEAKKNFIDAENPEGIARVALLKDFNKHINDYWHNHF